MWCCGCLETRFLLLISNLLLLKPSIRILQSRRNHLMRMLSQKDKSNPAQFPISALTYTDGCSAHILTIKIPRSPIGHEAEGLPLVSTPVTHDLFKPS